MTMILNAEPIEILEMQAIDVNGHLKVLPFKFWKDFSQNQIKLFMLKHGLYFIPTTEIIHILKSFIVDDKTIEIGCGNGALGRALKIPITDSKLQENESIKEIYKKMGQPTIKYPSDVIKLNAEEAIDKYKPKTVIGSFITHKFNGIDGNYYGVDEEKLLKTVDNYIMIGNTETHRNKPILNKYHVEIYNQFLITRSVDQSKNRIFIWIKKYYS